MKDQLQTLRTSLEKLGFEYLQENPGAIKDQVDASFHLPSKVDDPIGKVLSAIAAAGLLASSVGIFPAHPRNAIILRGLRLLASASEQNQEPAKTAKSTK